MIMDGEDEVVVEETTAPEEVVADEATEVA